VLHVPSRPKSNRKSPQIALALALGWPILPIRDAAAQGTGAWNATGLKTEIYFGSEGDAGQNVSAQAWDDFVSDVVVPRFPAGLTVLEGLGRGGRTSGPLSRVRVLVVVHPSDRDAEARISEIKAEYRKRFATVGIFQTDQPVRLQDPR
jgi:hypothetical protein